jgi:hypothetical protein
VAISASVGPLPDLEAEADAQIGREMRAAWRYLGKKGRQPKNAVDAVLGLGDYLRNKDERLSDIGRFQRSHPAFREWWRRVRVCCDGCDDGYLVVRKRWGRNIRFAGCSRYTETGCNFTMGSRDYARLKAEIILDLGRGVEPSHAFFVRDLAAS